MEEFDDSMARILLAELVDALGGVAKLDAEQMLDNMRNKRFKSIGLRIENGEAILEVFEENE